MRCPRLDACADHMGLAVSINKKRGGPSHRVAKEELGDSFPNDWLECGIVVLFLAGVSFGAYGIYMISQAV